MHDLSLDDATSILSASRMGVLGLAKDHDAYTLPMFFGYDGQAVYMHCHPGEKDVWIEGTQQACLAVIHQESENIWESVQVFGTLERLSINTDLAAAKSALYHVPFPPAEGHYPSGKPIRSDQRVYYLRLTPTHIEGKASGYQEKAQAAE